MLFATRVSLYTHSAPPRCTTAQTRRSPSLSIGKQTVELLLDGLHAHVERLPRRVYGRTCLHFVDNTSALSAAVHGYSFKPDMAALTNMLHSIDAALRVDCYFEWVPSAANISDIPSRDPRRRTSDDVRIMAELDATRRVMRLPSPAQWRDLTLLLDAKTAIAGATLCPLRAQGAAPPS